MKALFAHDTRFVQKDGTYYSNGLNSTVLSRYTAFFDSLVVCGRQVDANASDKISEKQSSVDKVEYRNIPNKNAISIWFNIKDRLHIKSLVKDVDFVIARLDSIIGFLAVDYAVKFNKPYLIELCTDPWDCYINYGLKGKILAPFVTLKTKLLVRNANNVVYVTKGYLQSKYPNNCHNTNISNVECVPDSHDYENKQSCYKSIQLDKDPVIIGTAGALLPFKGQRFVIEALAILKSKGYKNFYYHMAGDGGDKKALQELATSLGVNDNVEFRGKLSHDDMAKFYSSLHLYIQPSLQEGLPRTVIEAMSHGLCCLGSRIAGTPELLDSSRIFSNKAPQEIAKMILRLSNQDLLKDSTRNYKESFKYEKMTLFNKRLKFIEESIK